jgi:hypothetical protein
MLDQINPWLAGRGLGLGAAFGIIAQRSRFCVVSAVSNFALMRDNGRCMPTSPPSAWR